MPTVTKDHLPYTSTLAAGKQLTVVTAAASTAILERLSGGTVQETFSMAASTTKVLGEYRVDQQYRVTGVTGTTTITESQSVAEVVGRAADGGSAAAAGEIGEILTSTVAVGAAVAETTATPVNVTSLALTAGEWEVTGIINRVLTGTTATAYGAAISPTANTVPAQAGGSGVAADSSVTLNAVFGATVTGNFVSIVGPVSVSLAAAATIYLVAADTFSAGSVGVFGTLRARRVR